jgi:signal transduction histidine kinase
MGLLQQLPTWLRPFEPSGGDADRLRRRDALVEAAVALAAEVAEGGLDGVMHQAVRATAEITGAAAILILVNGDGGLERLAAEGVDRSTREAVVRPEVLGPLVRRLREIGRPVSEDDVEGDAGRTLAALAPYGMLAVPVGPSIAALFLLIGPHGWRIDEERMASATMLATLAARALDGTQRVATLLETSDALRRFAGEILERRDEQLRHTARELHEGIGQRLAAANAQLQALDPLLEGSPPAARERFRDARSLVVRTLGELRDLAHTLRPSVLEDFGYVQALRWLLRRLRTRDGISFALEVEGAEVRLPIEVEGALFRATEEVLAGFGHGEDGRVLRVRYRGPSGVTVEIAGSTGERVELGPVRERLRPFGGEVHVTSAPADPLVVALEMP